MEEGVARLTVSAVVSEESAAMSKASSELAVQGLEEIAIGAEVGKAAQGGSHGKCCRDLRRLGRSGSAALAMEEVATSLKKKSE